MNSFSYLRYIKNKLNYTSYINNLFHDPSLEFVKKHINANLSN